jgi:uncharacterized protein YkwD
MASALDDGDRSDRPRRPTSHRRRTPRAQRGLRRSAITAAVAGLAITTPLLLRAHGENEIALGPETSAPAVPAPAATTASAPAPSPDADPAGAADSRSATPVSRDASRSAAALPGSQSTQPPQTPQTSQPSQSTSTGTGPQTVQSSPDQAAAYEAEVVALTNQQRLAHGCPALRDDSRLRAAAIGHSVDMRVRDYFTHNTPDGVTPWTRVEARGYSDPSAENIAMGQQTPQSVVDAWMNSPGHRANILNCSSKAIGVGVEFGPAGPWWTQDFGYS